MADKFKVFIADNLAEEGVEILNKSGIIDVEYRKKTPREDLLKEIKNYDGLIIRSATTVDAEVLEVAEKLKVVIRAGVGVDNIDILACSQKGIVLMNAPGGNSISTAEQAIALMFASARMTPQANASMKEKKWEKPKFKGSQLTGKTLGVVGLGRIGKEVVKRGKGLQMNVLGFDPFIPKANLEHLQIDIVDIDTILSNSDFISVHTPLTENTKHLVNTGNLDKLKDGVRLINCARGGIYEEAAIAKGLNEGKISAAGLDVFTQEPPAEDFLLYNYDNAILTPHLGASTDEAQIEVAKETAQEMVDFLKDGIARNSLNFPTLDPKEMDVLAPWFELCQRLGSFAGQVVENPITDIDMEFYGKVADLNLSPLEIAMSRGILTVALGETVNLVNAPILAKERGLDFNITKRKDDTTTNSVLKVIFKTAKEQLQIRATINFSGGAIIGINNLPLEFLPVGNILFIKNKDVPNVVGDIGIALGELGVNIASLHLSRDVKGGTALTIVQVDDDLGKAVIDKLESHSNVVLAKNIKIVDAVS